MNGQYEQINLFSLGKKKFKIEQPIRLIELFAGIGSQAMALRDLGADFEHYKVVEFDKYAIKSYNAIHGTDFEPMDITKIIGSVPYVAVTMGRRGIGVELKESYYKQARNNLEIAVKGDVMDCPVGQMSIEDFLAENPA